MRLGCSLSSTSCVATRFTCRMIQSNQLTASLQADPHMVQGARYGSLHCCS